jgi:hypothetical protein
MLNTTLAVVATLWLGYRIYRNRRGFWRWLRVCTYWLAWCGMGATAACCLAIAIWTQNPLWMLGMSAAAWVAIKMPDWSGQN